MWWYMHTYCHSHNNWGPQNSFPLFLVLVYYWKTIEKPETDPQLLWEWQYLYMQWHTNMSISSNALWHGHAHTHTSIPRDFQSFSSLIQMHIYHTYAQTYSHPQSFSALIQMHTYHTYAQTYLHSQWHPHVSQSCGHAHSKLNHLHRNLVDLVAFITESNHYICITNCVHLHVCIPIVVIFRLLTQAPHHTTYASPMVPTFMYVCMNFTNSFHVCALITGSVICLNVWHNHPDIHVSNHLYRRSMCVNNQCWLFTHMDQWYKWFDKKQAGGRKLPLSERNLRINFRRNWVFCQATVPSGHRPCHVYHTSTFPWESLLLVPGLFTTPKQTPFYYTTWSRNDLPLKPRGSRAYDLLIIYTADPCV